MAPKPGPGNGSGLRQTVVDLPQDLKDRIVAMAAEEGTSLRVEVIAALTAWWAHPDEAIRAQAKATHHLAPGRKRQATP